MGNIAKLIIRVLHLLGVRPAEAYVRNMLAIVRWTYLPAYVFGIVAPYFLEASWLAWITLIFCGFTWFVFEAHMLVPTFLARLIPEKVWKLEIPKVPEEFHPKQVGHVLSTIGMWALVPHFVIAVTQIYQPVVVPFIGVTKMFYPALIGSIMVILSFVATEKVFTGFYRRMLGWGVTVIVIGMVAMFMLLRFAPGTIGSYVYWADRIDQRAAVENDYLDDRERLVVRPQLDQINRDVISLEIEMYNFQRTNPGQTWPRQAELDNLLALKGKLGTVPAAPDAEAKESWWDWATDFNDEQMTVGFLLFIGLGIAAVIIFR